MSIKGNLFLSTLAVLAFSFSTSAQLSANANGEPFGAIQINKLIVMPDSAGHKDWIDAIKSARSSLHMMMYHLTDKEVIDALAARKTKGSIEIKVIVDGKSIKGGYKKAIDELTAAGVEVRPSSNAFSITHAKSLIVDNNSAFITAINLTNTATNSRDFGIITPDQRIISEMESVFQGDWANALNDGSNTPALRNENLVWSPNNSLAKLTTLIDSAQHTLYAEVESFSNDNIIAAFNRAAARGVEVRLIVPECVYGGNPGFNYEYLAKLTGVNAHTEHNGLSIDQPYMHSKMMLVDGKRVYIGSINYSLNSITMARELGVIFLDTKVGKDVGAEFDKDWKRSNVANPNACKSVPPVTDGLPLAS